MSTHSHKILMPDLVMDLVYSSYLQAASSLHGPDSATRELAYTQELFALLNIDFHRWPRVTVTGSKGKGSTSVLLASILQASGERVGLVSSPEMRQFNERIRIDGQCVSDEVLLSAARAIAPAVQSITARLKPPHYLGPGGVILALAATIFAQAKITALVVEAGRGGEYDEVRLVEGDVSVLTPIMLEHIDKLGTTLQDIARTKTYITAPGRPIVTAPQTSAAQAVIESIGATLQSEIFSMDAAMRIGNVKTDSAGINCDIQFGSHFYKNLHISLAGRHQTENAATALLAAHVLSKVGTHCTDEGIFRGTSRVRWPGRAQMLQQRPWVLLDGAIGRESAAHICGIVKDYAARRVTAVLCVPKPKDLAGVCAQIATIAQRIILTELPTPTLTWYEDAVAQASRYCSDVHLIASAEAALTAVLADTPEDEGVLLLGTQSFLGTALQFWNVDTCCVW